MEKKIFLFTLCLFMGVSLAFSQATRTVTGVVLSKEENEPIIGASVLIPGTTVGTITNVNGDFVLPNVPTTAKNIQVSYIGMKTVEVPITDNKMRIFVESDTETLEEVVVLGYGSAKKLGSVVSSVSTVNNKKLKNIPNASFADALQGQVAGLSVSSSSGEPSSTANIRLRGMSSINAGITPLYILDGAPVSQVIFTTMNPDDIENITVLKDASATAIYGSRAANGVIVITSKKGKMGEKAQVTLKAQYGVSNLIDNGMKMMNSQEYMQFREMLEPKLATDKDWIKHKQVVKQNNIDTDWADEVYRNNAPTYNLDLSVSGGGNNNSYYISLNHNNTEGIAPTSEMRRTSLRTNLEIRANNWLKLGINSNLAFQKYNANPDVSSDLSLSNPATFARLGRPDDSPRYYQLDENGNAIFGDRADYLHESQILNPLYMESYRDRDRRNFSVNLNLFEEIRPVKGLILRAVQALEGFDYTYSSNVPPIANFTTPMGDVVQINDAKGQARENFQRFYRFTFTNTAEYKFNVENKHFVTLLLGQESIISKDNSFGTIVDGLTDSRLMLLSNGTEYMPPSHSIVESVFNSYFFRGDYTFKEKYYIDASYRLDGSSRFTPKYRWAEFYSLGAKWNLKAENFMSNINWLNDLGIRISYGSTGNSSIGDYAYQSLLASSGVYEGESGTVIVQPGNPDLTWETVTSANIGVDFRLFNRIYGSIDLYRKKTSDMLMSIPYSYTTGFGNNIGNIGGMVNKGIDLNLNVDLINNAKFFWTFRASLNYNKNEITELFNGLNEYVIPDTGTKLKIGRSYGELYCVKRAGVDPRDGKIVWYDKNGNLTKTYSEDNATFIDKQMFAPWTGGFGTTASWKGLTATVDFSFALNKYMINYDRYVLESPNDVGLKYNQTKRMLNMWTTPGQVTDIPAATEKVYLDDSFAENSSYLRLRTLSISYALPKKLIQKSKFFESCNIFFVGRNLLTFTDFTGYDPEPEMNAVKFNYPNTRQYSVGVEVSF